MTKKTQILVTAMLGSIALLSVFSVVWAMPIKVESNQRLIDVSIRLDGKIILYETLNDDGGPNVDDVWNYLKSEKLTPSEDFPEFDRSQKDANLKLTGKVQIHIQYGGLLDLESIELVHSLDANGDSKWRVSPEIIDSRANFTHRLITRHEAERLVRSSARDRNRNRP